MRLLGLDIGTKRIGIAVSDDLGLTATPLSVLKRSSLNIDLADIARIAAEECVELIVAGMPLNMDGSKGPSAEKAERFLKKLGEHTEIKIKTWDERLSTKAVTKVLIEADMTRAKRREVVDKLSASYILQGFLDSKKKGNT